MKRCNSCGETKPLTEFHNRKSCAGGKDTNCRSCRKDQQSKKLEMPAQRKKAYLRELRARARRYDEELAAQGGVCAICKEPPEEGGSRFCRDHDHATGNRRALLCRSCNYGLGCFKDDPEKLSAAATYLLSFSV